MKTQKKMWTLGLFLLVTSTSKNLLAQNPLSIYAGFGTSQFEVTDFDNFDISDWEKYGLLSQNSNSDEGRLTVPLSTYRPKSSNLGLFIGGSFQFNDKIAGVAEWQYAFSGIKLQSYNLGINYTITKSKSFKLCLLPKLNYNQGDIYLGQIKLLPNYTPPVILPQGTFNVGDSLTMNYSGFGFNIGLCPQIKLSDNIWLYSNLAYSISFTNSDGLLCNKVKLPMTALGVVKSDGYSTQSSLAPNIKSKGYLIQIGVAFSL